MRDGELLDMVFRQAGKARVNIPVNLRARHIQRGHPFRWLVCWAENVSVREDLRGR